MFFIRALFRGVCGVLERYLEPSFDSISSGLWFWTTLMELSQAPSPLGLTLFSLTYSAWAAVSNERVFKHECWSDS